MRLCIFVLAGVASAARPKTKFLEGFPSWFKFALCWWCVILLVGVLAFLIDIAFVRLRPKKRHKWDFQYVFPPDTDLKTIWRLLAEPETWPKNHPTLAGVKLPVPVPKVEKGGVLKLYELDAHDDDPERLVLVQHYLEVEPLKKLCISTESPPYPIREETSTLTLSLGNSNEVVLDICTEVVLGSRLLAKFQSVHKNHICSLTEWCKQLHKIL